MFFAVPKRYDEPELMGSIGGGLNFEEGVITELAVNGESKIYWNNELITANVTKTAIRFFENITGIKSHVDIYHKSEIPIGFGLSTSGAGSLGTLFVLNEHYNTKLLKKELFDLAHASDLYHNTGLGSVVGQITGGLEFRLTQGNPSNCETRSIPNHTEIILGFVGSLSTSDVLTSEKQMALVTSTGMEINEKVKNNKVNNLDELIDCGRYFMNHCGLRTPIIEKYVQGLSSIGEDKVTMAMIGETLIIKPTKMENVTMWLLENNITYLRTRISNKLPHLI